MTIYTTIRCFYHYVDCLYQLILKESLPSDHCHIDFSQFSKLTNKIQIISSYWKLDHTTTIDLVMVLQVIMKL